MYFAQTVSGTEKSNPVCPPGCSVISNFIPNCYTHFLVYLIITATYLISLHNVYYPTLPVFMRLLGYGLTYCHIEAHCFTPAQSLLIILWLLSRLACCLPTVHKKAFSVSLQALTKSTNSWKTAGFIVPAGVVLDILVGW